MERSCKNCHTHLKGKYCYSCGQRHYTEQDKSLKHIAEEALHFLTHFEGTFVTTLKTVLSKPGKLSLDYCNGIRARYYKPISFFLILIVIYLIFPVMQGLNMNMAYYKTNAYYGPFITEQIEAKLGAMNISETELTTLFREKSEKTSKVMLLLLIPLTAGALWVLYFYKKRLAFDYFIMATEINIFTVLVLFLLSPLFFGGIYKITGYAFDELWGSGLLMLVYLAYLVVTIKRFFGEGWLKTVIKSLLFIGLYGFATQIIYKFLLFQVTFWLV